MHHHYIMGSWRELPWAHRPRPAPRPRAPRPRPPRPSPKLGGGALLVAPSPSFLRSSGFH